MAASLFATVLYLSRVQIPIPAGYRNGKFRWVHFNLFGQFPVGSGPLNFPDLISTFHLPTNTVLDRHPLLLGFVLFPHAF